MFSEEEKMGSPLVGETQLSESLVNAGKNLLKPHSSTQALLHLLNEAEAQLSKLVQDPTVAVQNALRPLMKALVSAHLLRNRDSDVRVCVVSCLTEIMRITAPEAPYNDDQMKEIFQVTVRAFGKLADDTSCPSYKKAVTVLDTVSRVRLSSVMLDLECDDLILNMFRQFLKVIRPNHPESVLLSMEAIMVTIIHESEQVPMDLLQILLAAVNKENQDVSPMAWWLVEKVIISCACKLQPCIMEALKSTRSSLDMYSPVVLAICQGEAEAYIVVKPKQVEGQLDFSLSRKGTMSKRIARCSHGDDDKVKDGYDLKQLLKQVRSESRDAETEPGSSKKMQEKEVGKLTAKKASLPSKVGQTNQAAVVSSLSPSSRPKKGSRKRRSRSEIEDTNLDAGCLATPASKKQIVKKENPEEDFMESDLEKPQGSIKTAKSSKKDRTQNVSAKASAKKPLAKSKDERAHNGSAKASAEKALVKFKDERAHNGLAKTSAKKPLAESKRVEDSWRKPVHSESKGASMDLHIPQSSKSKMSRAVTPSTKESDQTPRSHPKRKRTAGEEVESSHKSEELVGKRMKVWWPLDKKFYEGVIKSYCSLTKRHEVSYSDGDVEILDLKKERWEIIQDHSSSSDEKEIDLPDSTLLSDIRGMQKAKKSRYWKKKDPVTNSSKLKSVSKSREEKNPKEPNAESGRRKGRTEKRQMVTLPMHQESEKDCDDKEEPETKGDDNSLKFRKESNEEPNTEEQERESAKEPRTDTKLIEEDMSGEIHRDAYTSVPPETDQRVVKETGRRD